MSTGIGWTDETWNFLLGCYWSSRGCDRCFAIRTANIRAHNPHPAIARAYEGLVARDADGHLDWTGEVRVLGERLTIPLRWRNPRRIFVNSMSDLFHPKVPTEVIARAYAVMALAVQHHFQILTKRERRMRSVLNSPAFRVAVERAMYALAADETAPLSRDARRQINASEAEWVWPLPNVWVGVSVEDQKAADRRIPALLDTLAAVRWISAEPLLGPIDLHSVRYRGDVDYLLDPLHRRHRRLGQPATDGTAPFQVGLANLHGLDWVVVGGETAPVQEDDDGALVAPRPMHPDWVRSLRDQCIPAEVAFYFKQWGDVAPSRQVPAAASTSRSVPRAWLIDLDGATRAVGRDARGDAVTVQRVGVKAAGNTIDGQVIEQYPRQLAPAGSGGLG